MSFQEVLHSPSNRPKRTVTMPAEYIITIQPGGKVTSDLVQEDVNQRQACDRILTLMNSLGRVTDHSPDCADPQPVNQGIFVPGTDGNSNNNN